MKKRGNKYLPQISAKRYHIKIIQILISISKVLFIVIINYIVFHKYGFSLLIVIAMDKFVFVWSISAILVYSANIRNGEIVLHIKRI